MSEMTMETRVTNLEKLAESLAPLPAEVGKLTERVGAAEGRLSDCESQIVQLRTDMKAGFSAVRGEMAAMKEELREDIAAQGREMAAGFLEMDKQFKGVHLKLDRLLLKGP